MTCCSSPDDSLPIQKSTIVPVLSTSMDELSKLVLTPEERNVRPEDVGSLSPCLSNQLRSIEIRGLRLGVPLSVIRERIPVIKVPPANQYGYTRATLFPELLRHAEARQEFKGIRYVNLDFLAGRLTAIYFVYDDSIKWRSSGEFISRVSEALKLPGGWEPFRSEDSYRTGELRALECGNFRLVAGLTTINYREMPMLYFGDTSANAKLLRRAAEAEQKRVLREEERRRAFRP